MIVLHFMNRMWRFVCYYKEGGTSRQASSLFVDDFQVIDVFLKPIKSCYPCLLTCPIIVDLHAFNSEFSCHLFSWRSWSVSWHHNHAYVIKMCLFPWTCAGQDLFTTRGLLSWVLCEFSHWSLFTSIPQFPWCPFVIGSNK